MFATEVTERFTELIQATDVMATWTDARCRDQSVATVGLFFSDEIPDIARARAICQDCSYRDACLEGALERREPWGVWGGQLFANGRILAQKRKRGRPPKNPPAEYSLIA